VRQHLLTCINPKRQLKVRLQCLTEDQLHAFTKPHSDEVQLNLHLQTDGTEKNSEPSEPATPTQAHSADLEFSCLYCGLKFLMVDKYLTHCKQHKTETAGVFKCLYEGCQQLFSSAIELIKHSGMHKVKMFTCETCGKLHQTGSELRSHNMMWHLDERPFHCDFSGCFYTCALKAQLQIHKISHYNHGWKCHLCGKFIKQMGNAKAHLLKHKTNFPGIFKCSFVKCSHKTFLSTDELKKHSLSHEKKTNQ
jgi:hypothetical protein